MPSVLLVPDKFHWILGQIAGAIVEHNPEFDIAFSTRRDIRSGPDRVEALGRGMDIIHWVLDLEFYDGLPIGLREHPVQVASVHHVLDWEKAKRCLAATRIHVVSSQWKDYLVEHGADPRRVALVPNGVDTVRFNEAIPRSSARKRLGLPEAAFVVGFFGSAHPPSRPRKGVDVFLEAMSSLSKQIPELVVFLSGQAWGPDLETLRRAGVAVVYPGFLASRRLAVAYRALDLFVVASTIEGGPMTAFEALACGTPVVSTPVGMVRDWLQDGVHATLVEQGRAEALAEAVRRVHRDPAAARALAAEGRRLVQSRLKWSDAAAGYGAVYREALAEAGSRRARQRPVRWYERQRQAVLREDIARLMEQQIDSGHPARAAEVLLFDGRGITGRMASLGRLATRYCHRGYRTVRGQLGAGLGRGAGE